MTLKLGSIALMVAVTACAGGPPPAPAGQVAIFQVVWGEYQDTVPLLRTRIPTMVLDTATVLESIADHLIGIARFGAQDSRIHPIRIDTTFADWDRAVARVIRRKDPAVLPTLPDSVAYYTDLWSVSDVHFQPDSVFVRLLVTGCSPPSQGSGSDVAWSWEVLTRASPVLRPDRTAAMGSGSGRCPPYERSIR